MPWKSLKTGEKMPARGPMKTLTDISLRCKVTDLYLNCT